MDDLISREAAIGYALNGRVREGVNGEMWIRMKDVEESLLDVPSAEKTGEWEPSIIRGKKRCSRCGSIWDETLITANPFFIHCPRCGSKNRRNRDE